MYFTVPNGKVYSEAKPANWLSVRNGGSVCTGSLDLKHRNYGSKYSGLFTFNAMVARQDIIYMKLGSDRERRLTFNLDGPVTFLNSKESFGIQIADVLSCSIAYAFNHPDEPFSKQCIALAHELLSPLCILPDPNEMDIHQKHAVINTIILSELVDRSVKKESLFDRMEEYIEGLYRYYELSPPKFDESAEKMRIAKGLN